MTCKFTCCFIILVVPVVLSFQVDGFSITPNRLPYRTKIKHHWTSSLIVSTWLTEQNKDQIAGTTPLDHFKNSTTTSTNDTTSMQRRNVLTVLCGTATIISGCVTIRPSNVAAATPVDFGESIRQTASNIPGYGPSDVFYPIEWQGTWKVRREIILLGDSLSSSSPSTDPVVLEYNMRFIPSIQENAVIADRGYNQVNLETSIRKQQVDAVRSYKWSENNPNDLIIEFANGTRKYIKVTKRATEIDSTTGIVSSSEYQRLTEDDSRGIPLITARRILSKWIPVLDTSNSKIVRQIKGMEIVYTMPGGGDPLSFQQPQQQQSTVLFKSNLFLERIE